MLGEFKVVNCVKNVYEKYERGKCGMDDVFWVEGETKIGLRDVKKY